MEGNHPASSLRKNTHFRGGIGAQARLSWSGAQENMGVSLKQLRRFQLKSLMRC